MVKFIGNRNYWIRPCRIVRRKAKTRYLLCNVEKKPDQVIEEETLADKIIKAYAKAKLKAGGRKAKRKKKGNSWNPKLNELVLIKRQLTSDVIQGMSSKFKAPYEGPYIINKLINPYLYHLKDISGNDKGMYHLTHLKPYLINENEKEVKGMVLQNINEKLYNLHVDINDKVNNPNWSRWKIRPPPKRKNGSKEPAFYVC
jgi:hypothetical protein